MRAWCCCRVRQTWTTVHLPLFLACAEHCDSQLSRLSASTTLLHRNSSTASRPHSQNPSSIIVVAEQEPGCPRASIQRSYSQKRHSTTENQRYPLTFESTNSLCLFPFPATSKHLAPSLHFPANDERDIEIESRPSSAHSMPQPTTTSISNYTNPVRARAPTPFSASLMHHHSLAQRSSQSQRSSMGMQSVDAHTDACPERGLHLSELEARIEAVERKNLLLERALLATIDGVAGLDGRRVDGLGWGMSAGDGRRASAASGNESGGWKSVRWSREPAGGACWGIWCWR